MPKKAKRSKRDEKPKTFTRVRDARTGRYLPRGTEKRRKATTVVETARRKDSCTVKGR